MEILNEKFKNFNIILASHSPRRKDLLAKTKLNFTVKTPEKPINENISSESINKLDFAKYLAQKKADSMNSVNEKEIIIAADTIVLSNNKILGKPDDEEEAKEMLMQMSGKEHKVITGVCIKSQHKRVSFDSKTDVKFKDLQKHEIDFYIKNFNTSDKAGAYGIQDWIGLIGIEYISGCYYNVMGLPVNKLFAELYKF